MNLIDGKEYETISEANSRIVEGGIYLGGRKDFTLSCFIKKINNDEELSTGC